jgi:hypothetical protein
MPQKILKTEPIEKANPSPKAEAVETTPRKPLDPWDKEARRIIKVEMARADLTPKDLAELLRDSGYGSNTPKALAQRIVRGSFNFGFALRILNIMGVQNLDLTKIDPAKHKKPRKS